MSAIDENNECAFAMTNAWTPSDFQLLDYIRL
jgi:hypothetical protein